MDTTDAIEAPMLPPRPRGQHHAHDERPRTPPLDGPCVALVSFRTECYPRSSAGALDVHDSPLGDSEYISAWELIEYAAVHPSLSLVSHHSSATARDGARPLFVPAPQAAMSSPLFPSLPTSSLAPQEVPLDAYPHHPVAAALHNDGLVRRWLLPDMSPAEAAAVAATMDDVNRPTRRRLAASAACLPAGLTRAGLAQAVGFTSAIVVGDASIVQHVHVMVRLRAGVVQRGRRTRLVGRSVACRSDGGGDVRR